MAYRIVLTKALSDSLAELPATPEVSLLFRALVVRARSEPLRATCIEGTQARVIRSRRYGSPEHPPEYPPIRLIFWVAEQQVHLFKVAEYDELRMDLPTLS